MNKNLITKLLLKYTLIFSIVSVIIGTVSSCSTDFELNEPHREQHILYGLVGYTDSFYLGPGFKKELIVIDSVQYFKIGKAYQNANTSALEVAKIQDSLYFANELEAKLEENLNGALKSFDLLRVTNIPKQAGVFAYPGQVLYRTPYGFRLNVNATYTLIAKNKTTGKESSGATQNIGKTELRYLFNDNNTGFNKVSDYLFQWYAAKNAKFYDLNIKIYIKEWNVNNPSDTTRKVLNWQILKYYATPSLKGGEQMTYQIRGQEFYTFLSQSLNIDAALKRKLTGVEFIFDAGGEEIYNYINVNTPALGVVQKLPEYTNIQNGYGIFSCKSTTKILKTLDKRTQDALIADELTKRLNFVKP